MNQLSVLDDPTTTDDERLTADTTRVPVYNYAISRGKCDAFADAGADGFTGGDAQTVQSISNIRNNYGLGCNGVRMPATAKTLYQASGKLNYSYGTGSRVSLLHIDCTATGASPPTATSPIWRPCGGIWRSTAGW